VATRGKDAPTAREGVLDFRVLATRKGMPTGQIGGITMTLKEGQPMAPFLVALSLTSNQTPCLGTGVLVTPSLRNPFEDEKPPILTWVVSGTVRRASTDQIVAAYEWKRTMLGPDGAPRSESVSDEVTLKEDGRVLLDLIPAVAQDPSGCLRNLALELGARIPEESAPPARHLAYDLWLVSRGAGPATTRRLQLIGKQGARVDFDFGPLVSGAPAGIPERSTGRFETTVTGQVRGRLQPDGSLEIALFAQRGLSYEHGTVAAHGEKVFRAATGEAVRLELPPPDTGPLTRDPAVLAAGAWPEIALVMKAAVLRQ
jgi:hypothetical protein